VAYGCDMRLDSGYLGWGVFFVVAGAIALAIEAGQIPDQAWWTYWPLLLVGAGLGLVLRRTPLEVIGGLMVGGSLATGFGGFTGVGSLPGGVCRIGDDATPFADRTGSFGGSASVDIELDCGTLAVATVPGAGWAVRGSDGDGSGPQIDTSAEDLEVDAVDGQSSPTAWLVDLPQDPSLSVGLQLNAGSLQATFAGGHILELDLEVNAGQARIDLTGVADIGAIDAGVNAGEVAITLPSSSMTGSVEVNAGSVRLCAPPDVALRIETEGSVLASTDMSDAGLVQVDGTWISPDYDTAPIRIDLRVQANLGTVRLDPAEGCA
jgi:hypothetical protein